MSKKSTKKKVPKDINQLAAYIVEQSAKAEHKSNSLPHNNPSVNKFNPIVQ